MDYHMDAEDIHIDGEDMHNNTYNHICNYQDSYKIIGLINQVFSK